MKNGRNLMQKLTSRKFLLSLITVAAGMALLVGADSGTVEILAAAAMTVVPAVVYCLMEGKVDAASAGTISRAIEEAAEKLGAEESVRQVIRASGDAVASLAETEEEPDAATPENGETAGECDEEDNASATVISADGQGPSAEKTKP